MTGHVCYSFHLGFTNVTPLILTIKHIYLSFCWFLYDLPFVEIFRCNINFMPIDVYSILKFNLSSMAEVLYWSALVQGYVVSQITDQIKTLLHPPLTDRSFVLRLFLFFWLLLFLVRRFNRPPPLKWSWSDFLRKLFKLVWVQDGGTKKGKAKMKMKRSDKTGIPAVSHTNNLKPGGYYLINPSSDWKQILLFVNSVLWKRCIH